MYNAIPTVATILFAGISNFDEWSSKREPLEIFNLLEALFGAFNTVAARRGVVKVETIGEVYVAVANVPEANPRHAILMTKFASDCLQKSSEVFNNLDPAIVGEGAQDLKLQIGIHTGPVCGGVLRGQRSRFQLFGDSVSTASKMQRYAMNFAQSLYTSIASSHFILTPSSLFNFAGRQDRE